MRVVKRYLAFAMLLIFFVTATAMLCQQFHVYRKTYRLLGRLISHPTIEVLHQEGGEEE